MSEVQSRALTDDMVKEAGRLLGVWLRRDVHWPAFAEPVSQHDIRRWALFSCGDDNPLWCDPNYAKTTIWAKTIAPPCYLFNIDTTIVAPGLPGIQWIGGEHNFEFFCPVYVGDTITARARLIKVTEKQGRRVPRFVVQTGETLFYNQNHRLVGRVVTDILRIPRARSGEGLRNVGDKAKDAAQPKYTPEQIESIRQEYLNEERRGSTPRMWEDVQVGDVVPRIVKGPLTLVDIVGFYAGRHHVYNPLKLAFLERERHKANVYVSPNTGIPIHPAAGHYDSDIAREVGFPRAYDQGWMRTNWIAHMLTNWAGDMSFIRKLDMRLSAPNYVGQTTWCKGEVVRKYEEDGKFLVEVKCWAENEKSEVTVKSNAIVQLPSRALADRFEI